MTEDEVDVEQLLGWLPIPPSPAELTKATRKTETLTVTWWTGGDTRTLDSLIQTWESLFADYRLTCHERAAMAYCWRAVSTGTAGDLARAAAHLTIVIEQDPPWPDDLLYHRGIYHYSAAAICGDQSEVEQAVAILRRLVDRLPTTDTRLRPRCADVLGRSLLRRDSGDPIDRARTVDEVIILLSETLAGCPPDAPYRGLIADHLATALGDRFKRTGRLADLDAAITALEKNPPVQTYRQADAMRSTLLGTYYGRRFRMLLDPDDMHRSLEWHDRAVAIAPQESLVYPAVLTNQGNALLWARDYLDDDSLVEQALGAQQRAVDLTDQGDSLYASRLNNLGNALSASHELTGDGSSLDRAVDLYERAIAITPPDDADLPSRHYNAANNRYLRYRLSGRRRDLQAAERHYRQACQLGLEREPEWALGAARQWGQLAGENDDWREAAEPYRIAVTAVERLFHSQLSRAHKEAWLRTADGLPAQAGYALYRAGSPVDAVLIQEQGRALLLAEALRRANSSSRSDDVARPSGGVRPLSIDDVFDSAGSRPLIYLDAARLSGVALVADPRSHTVRALNLPGLCERAVIDRDELLRMAYRDRHREPGRWLGAVDAVGRWAYDVVIGPLLKALPDVDAVTLVPVGRLTMLPLHAAWEPSHADEEGRRYALDRMAISYVATARALAAARDGMTPSVRRALVIDEPAPVDAPPLPLSYVEAAAVGLAIEQVRVLTGPRASRAAVLAEYSRYDLIHMSCHGHGRPDSPLDSGLLLAEDELLRLSDLYELPPAGRGRPRLAILSACETDQPGAELPDEVVSLPTGLIQAGCRGVVAAQWEVSSLASALLTVRFYQIWRPQKPPGAALADAQGWVRRLTNRELAELARPVGDGSALGLPARAARPLWIAARRRPPEERRFAHPAYWGAFAHIGA